MSSEWFIFLTGGTGHTGSRLARRLLELGWRLKCLNHNPENARHLPQHPKLEIIQGDITQPETYAAAARGATAFINMAHVGFAEPVIAACQEAGVYRLISASSTRRFTRFPEATAQRVMAGEAAFITSRLDYTVIRSAMIYGGDRDNNLEKVVRWLRRHRVMPLLSGGRNLVQPIFTWDLVEALVAALRNPETTTGKMLTVAGPAPMTTRAMIETIGREMGRPPIWLPVPYAALMAGAWCLEKVQGRRPLVSRDQIRRQLEDKAFDIAEARAALPGWEPRPFVEGVRLKLKGEA